MVAAQKSAKPQVPVPSSIREALFLIRLAEMLGVDNLLAAPWSPGPVQQLLLRREVKYRPDSSDAFLPFLPFLFHRTIGICQCNCPTAVKLFFGGTVQSSWTFAA
jgi:hypothetical protein